MQICAPLSLSLSSSLSPAFTMFPKFDLRRLQNRDDDSYGRCYGDFETFDRNTVRIIARGAFLPGNPLFYSRRITEGEGDTSHTRGISAGRGHADRFFFPEAIPPVARVSAKASTSIFDRRESASMGNLHG